MDGTETTHVVVSGERIELRHLKPEDVSESYLAWMGDPEVTRYLEARFQEHTLESVREYVREVNAAEGSLIFAVVERADGRHIGNIKLGPINRHHETADLGVMIGERSSWGRGYGTEAIRLATTYAFEQLGVRKLVAGCYADNVGSATAFLRAGWQEDGIRRQHWVADDGSIQDCLQFAAFRDT